MAVSLLNKGFLAYKYCFFSHKCLNRDFYEKNMEKNAFRWVIRLSENRIFRVSLLSLHQHFIEKKVFDFFVPRKPPINDKVCTE